MGNKASRQTIEQKLIKEKIKDNVLNEKMEQLEKLKDSILLKKSTEVKNNNQIVDISYPIQKIQKSILYLVDVAKQQLSRKGKHLIKVDLIAIILTIRPEYIDRIDELQSTFTVDDLNLLIRSIVYDPNTYQQQLLKIETNSLQIENNNEIKYLE